MNNTCMYLYTPPWSWLLTYIPVYFRYSKCNGPRELFLLYKTVLYFTDISSYMYFSSLWGWFTFSIHSNNSYLHCTIINIFNAPEVCLHHDRKLPSRKRLYGCFSAYCLRSKCLVCCQHICIWSWMRALSWYPFHSWAVQVLCVVTAQGGGQC